MKLSFRIQASKTSTGIHLGILDRKDKKKQTKDK